MLGIGRVNKVFSPTIFISKNMVTNMKHALTKILFRHNSASAIQKWLRFKRVITVKLPYVSESKIIQVLHTCDKIGVF